MKLTSVVLVMIVISISTQTATVHSQVREEK